MSVGRAETDTVEAGIPVAPLWLTVSTDALVAVVLCLAWLGPGCLELGRAQALLVVSVLAMVWLGRGSVGRWRRSSWIDLTAAWLAIPALVFTLKLPTPPWIAIGLASSLAFCSVMVTPIVHRWLARGLHLRRFATLLASAALIAVLGPARGTLLRSILSKRAPEHAANILLITIDATRCDMLGCYGQAWPTSPHLDHLADEGARFEQAISQSPHTHGSLGTILTSTYPIEHRSIRGHERLEARNTTLAEHLEHNGYRTAAFLDNPWLTAEQGFAQGYREFSESAPTEAILSWLAEKREEPFFLHVHLLQPHAPYDAVEPWASQFSPDYPASGPYVRSVPIEILWNAKKHAELHLPPEDLQRFRALYASEVRQMDEEIGAILEQVERKGLAGRTIVSIVADHGEEFLDHGNLGHAETLYDELIHVPLLIRFPGRIPERTVVPEQFQLLDLAPTLLDLAGVDPMPTARGTSWSGRLSRARAAPASSELAISQVYRVRGRHLLAARSKPWKLFVMVTPIGPDADEGWQLFGPAASDFLVGNRVQLFDIEQDPGEKHDLSSEHSDVVDALLHKLEQWRTTHPPPAR